MKKKLLNALLCGVAILSVSVLASCKTDLSHVNSRLDALEGYYADVQAQLASALKEGNSVISYELSGSNYVITLNNGQKITIPLGEGGGSSVTVDTSTPGFVTITVNGTPYTFAVGSAVASLVYRPEFEDGIVELGTADVTVKFLAAPVVTDLTGATFKVADVYEIAARTRAGDGALMMVPNGAGTLEGEFINVPLRALEVTAGESYSVSIQMSLNGTVINSNYFTVKIDDNYQAKPEELDETIIPDAKYAPVKNEDKSYTITVDGLDMLKALNVKDFYGTTAPATATYKVAPAGKQPEGDAQAKQAMLAASLAADGTWEFTERPGTTFGAAGFQIEVLVNDEVKARTNITITDPLANVDWTGGLSGSAEAEYGARWGGLPLGVSTFDVQTTFSSVGTEEDGEGDGQNDWEIIHGGRDDFFAKWPTLMFMAGDDTVISNNGERLVTSEFADALAVKSRGLYWDISGFCLRPPVDRGEDGNFFPAFIGIDGQPRGGETGEWSAIDTWGADARDKAAQYGITITPAGILTMTDVYSGYCARLGFEANFEWAYGSHRLGAGDRFGLFFYNRRWWPAGGYMPADFVQQ